MTVLLLYICHLSSPLDLVALTSYTMFIPYNYFGKETFWRKTSPLFKTSLLDAVSAILKKPVS